MKNNIHSCEFQEIYIKARAYKTNKAVGEYHWIN